MTVELFQGDALEVLRRLPDASVDAVITDPPYSSGGMMRGDRMQDVHAKYVKTGTETGSRTIAPFTGDNRDQRSFLIWCNLWLHEALRVVRPGGACCVFADWRQAPLMTDALQVGGWVWRGIVPWYKSAGRRTQGRFGNVCEYVVWGSNGPRSLQYLGGRALNGFFDVSGADEDLDLEPVRLPGYLEGNAPRDRVHITEKPLAIMRELVEIAPPGGVILDPFMGGGGCGVAAVQSGRSFVGVELTAHHFEDSRRRIAAAEGEVYDGGAQLELLA